MKILLPIDGTELALQLTWLDATQDDRAVRAKVRKLRHEASGIGHEAGDQDKRFVGGGFGKDEYAHDTGLLSRVSANGGLGLF